VEYVVWIALALQAGAFAVLTRRLTRRIRREAAASGETPDRARARAEELSRREARLVELYGGVEELMDAFEGYLEEVRREIEAERASLRALTRPAADTPAQPDPAPPAEAPPEEPAPGAAEMSRPAPAAASRLSGPDREALARGGAKAQKVRFLLGRGLSVDEAARELGIGKGEARLIAALDR
jgi:hypothetical protein